MSVELQSAEEGTVDASPEVEHQDLEEDDDDGIDIGSDDHPLLIFYDCEATGLSIYSDHITDIAAKVVACHHCSNQLSPVWSEPPDVFLHLVIYSYIYIYIILTIIVYTPYVVNKYQSSE